MWQKLSEYWVQVVFENPTEEHNTPDNESDSAIHLFGGSKTNPKDLVEKSIHSSLVLKNVKRVLEGFKKKIGIGKEKNEFVEANFSSVWDNLVKLGIIE